MKFLGWHGWATFIFLAILSAYWFYLAAKLTFMSMRSTRTEEEADYPSLLVWPAYAISLAILLLFTGSVLIEFLIHGYFSSVLMKVFSLTLSGISACGGLGLSLGVLLFRKPRKVMRTMLLLTVLGCVVRVIQVYLFIMPKL